MAYNYQTQRAEIFTEDGQEMFLKIRDAAHKHIEAAGAVMMFKLMTGVSGDSWTMLACADRLIELGEIREVGADRNPMGQNRVFIRS